MDIDSKKWRVRSISVVIGHVEITKLATNETRYVPTRNVPDHRRAAAMHESAWDRVIGSAFSEGQS